MIFLDQLFSDPRSFVTLLSILISSAASIYAWVAQRSKAKAEEIDRLEGQITELNERLLKLEGEMAHLPNKDMITEIRLALSDLRGTVGTLGERVAGVAHTVGLIDETLRNGGPTR